MGLKIARKVKTYAQIEDNGCNKVETIVQSGMQLEGMHVHQTR